MMPRDHRDHDDSTMLAWVDQLLDASSPESAAPATLAMTVRQLVDGAPVPDPAFTQRLETQLLARYPRRSPRRHVPRWLSLAAAVCIVLAGMLMLSPRARLLAASTLDTAQHVWLVVVGGSDGIDGLQPPPPFTAWQLGATPPGFVLVGDRYAPEMIENSVRGELQAVDPETLLPDPIVAEAVGRDRGDVPHLVLVYRSKDQGYLSLFQRSARPDEPLPAGELSGVGTAAARFQTGVGRSTLTWVSGDTWFELEGTGAKELLLDAATNLRPIDPATASRVSPPPSRWGDALRRWGEPVPCSAGDQLPRGILLGQPTDQALLGVITLQISVEDEVLRLSSMSVNVPERERVLSAAAAALREPPTSTVKLPYRSVGLIMIDETNGCYRATQNPGYLVVEVWEREVRIGYSGTAVTRLAEAATLLERMGRP